MAYIKSGKWRVDIILNGERIQKWFPKGTPKRTIDEYEMKLKLGHIDPSQKTRSVPTLSDFAIHWLDNVVKVERSFSHYLKCEQTNRTHIEPRFGKKKLTSIDSLDVMEFQRDLRARGYAIQSINNILGCLSSMFKEAILQEHVRMNPVAGIKRLKKEQRDIEIWTIEEKNRFLATVKASNLRAFQICALALTTGLRPMEIRGLLRDAVDWDLGLIRVRRQWCTKQNKLVEYTKTRQARTVPIPRSILTLLSDLRGLPMTAQLFPEICNGYGHRTLKPLMRQADVKEIKMHDLRHTFASHMLMLGSPIMEVKELLGHRKLESTMVYLHFVGDRNKDATERLMQNSDWLYGSTPTNVVNLR